jgi:hypothetical protein
MSAFASVYGAVVMLVPDALGEAAFGGKWADAQPLLLPLALAQVAAVSALGPALVVYAWGQARRAFRLMVVEAPLVLALMLGGALLDGASGAAWGQFLDQLVMVGLWYATLRGVPPGPPSRPGVHVSETAGASVAG